MKNLIYLTLATFLFCTSITLNAQMKLPNRLFKKGQTDVYANLGLLSTFIADKTKSILPPLVLGAETMVSDHLSVGVSFGHSITRSQRFVFADGIVGRWNNRVYEFSAKTALHITKFDNVSIYGGFSLNYSISRVNPTEANMEDIMHHQGIKPKSTSFIPGGYVGLKYAITPRIIAMTELGYGISLWRMGVGFKI